MIMEQKLILLYLLLFLVKMMII